MSKKPSRQKLDEMQLASADIVAHLVKTRIELAKSTGDRAAVHLIDGVIAHIAERYFCDPDSLLPEPKRGLRQDIKPRDLETYLKQIIKAVNKRREEISSNSHSQYS